MKTILDLNHLKLFIGNYETRNDISKQQFYFIHVYTQPYIRTYSDGSIFFLSKSLENEKS